MKQLYVVQNNAPSGPYSEEDVRTGLDSGRFSYEQLAWRDGMPTWQPLAALFTPGASKPVRSQSYAPRNAPSPSGTAVDAYNRLLNAIPQHRAGTTTNRAPQIRTTTSRSEFGVITCNICGVGSLTHVKKHWASTPLVVIGYLAMVPSVLGVFMGMFFTLVAVVAAFGGQASLLDQRLDPQIQGGANVLLMGASGFGFVMGLLTICGSIMGSWLGWLLIMKRKYLLCSYCGATTPAS